VELGLAGGSPGAPPLYLAMGHLFFESMESFVASFPPHMAVLTADIPNYTDTTPVLQFSEGKM
jgi:uncharacterized protein (TIGR02118 family)